jgi:hypothetical protein
MSGYISDTSLMICQSVIQNHVSLLRLIGSCDREQLECVLDELNSALSGEPLEQVRKQRKELERIDQEEWEKAFGALEKKTEEEINEPLHTPIDGFICECLEPDPDCSVSIDKVYDAWNNWCKGKRVMNVSLQSFVRQLKIRQFLMARRLSNSQASIRELVGMRLKAAQPGDGK